MKKIDAHSHIGSFGGWAGLEMKIDDLIESMNLYDIEKTVLCGSGPENNDEVEAAYSKYPNRIIPLVYLNPLDQENTIKTLHYYINEKNFKGIKLNPLKHAYVADSEILNPIMEEADKLNIPVFIHCGHPPYSLPWSIALLAERYPNVKVIMIHMGHGHGVYIDASIKMAKRYSNLYLEMSGMPMSCKIKQAYKEVGSDRVLFGVDSPFHHPSVEIQKVLTSGLEEEELKDIFYNNTLKLFT